MSHNSHDSGSFRPRHLNLYISVLQTFKLCIKYTFISQTDHCLGQLYGVTKKILQIISFQVNFRSVFRSLVLPLKTLDQTWLGSFLDGPFQSSISQSVQPTKIAAIVSSETIWSIGTKLWWSGPSVLRNVNINLGMHQRWPNDRYSFIEDSKRKMFKNLLIWNCSAVGTNGPFRIYPMTLICTQECHCKLTN